MPRLPRWTRSTRWVKARAYAPSVTASTVLTCMVGALLPPIAGGTLFYGGLAVEALLFAGKGEQLVARVVAWSRPVTAAERIALGPALTLLCQGGLGPPVTVLRVQTNVHTIGAWGAGRRTVLISAGLVAAVRSGRLPADQAAAVIAHAAGPVVAGATRRDPALMFWTLPWQILRGIVGAALGAVGFFPVASLAWRARIIYAPLAIVTSAQDGHLVLGIAAAAIIVASYLIPRWERAWPAHLEQLGDRAVRQVGLAPALARFIRRWSSSPATFERIHRLTDDLPEQRATPPRAALIAVPYPRG
jgi:hypothetical protein